MRVIRTYFCNEATMVPMDAKSVAVLVAAGPHCAARTRLGNR